MTANLPPFDETRPVPAVDPTVPSVDPTVDRTGDVLRDLAVERLRKKAEFRMHLLMYGLVNGMLVLIWAMTGAHYFWPAFPMAGWGIGLVAHGVDTYGRGAPSEDDIRKEMDRLRRP